MKKSLVSKKLIACGCVFAVTALLTAFGRLEGLYYAIVSIAAIVVYTLTQGMIDLKDVESVRISRAGVDVQMDDAVKTEEKK